MTTKQKTFEAQEIIEDLLEGGYLYKEIEDAMCDGAYLEAENISQKLAEEIHDFCISKDSEA